MCCEKMKRLAHIGHAGQWRKDGTTPYIEHPAAVVKCLEGWGFKDWVLAVAWAHDLLEDTPSEQHPVLVEKLLQAAEGLQKSPEQILSAIRLLTYDKTRFASKADYLRHIAETADFSLLAVKIADRLCNTLDFIRLLGHGDPKAQSYLAAGEPLFAALQAFQDPRKLPILVAITRVKHITASATELPATSPLM